MSEPNDRKREFTIKYKDESDKRINPYNDDFKKERCPITKSLKKLCNTNCLLCFSRSFASSYRAKQWSPYNKVLPRQIFRSTHTIYKFDCETCHHEFETTPHSISNMNSWCGYCGNKYLCFDGNCTFCYNKSFLTSDKSYYWSNTNKQDPRLVYKCANDSYKFDCDVCKHTFEIVLNNITTGNQWCGFCGNVQLCNDNGCKYCENKSFAICPNSIYWSKKNDKIPRNVFLNSHKKYIFDCPDCKNEYTASLQDVANGHWCGCVKNKTEAKLYKFLLNNYPTIKIEKQKKIPWCKNEKNNYLPFDFFIQYYQLIIELDGRQHFKQVLNWTPPKEQQETDLYKTKVANEHNYSMVRLFQEDVWSDKNDWQNKLKGTIKKYDQVTNILIGEIYNNTDYEKYINNYNNNVNNDNDNNITNDNNNNNDITNDNNNNNENDEFDFT